MKKAIIITIFSTLILASDAKDTQPAKSSIQKTQKIDMHGGKSNSFGAFNPQSNNIKTLNDLTKEKKEEK